MNFYRGALKGYLVLAGVALTLATSFQQTHALCQWFGCSRIETCVSQRVTTKCGSGCTRCCSQQPKVPKQTPGPKTVPYAPCGPDCICSQPSQPLENPRNAIDAGKAKVVTSIKSCPERGSISSLVNLPTVAELSVEDAAGDSSVQSCQRLCRFLI